VSDLQQMRNFYNIPEPQPPASSSVRPVFRQRCFKKSMFRPQRAPHEAWNRVDRQLESRFTAAKAFLRPLSIFDVDTRSVPLDDFLFRHAAVLAVQQCAVFAVARRTRPSASNGSPLASADCHFATQASTSSDEKRSSSASRQLPPWESYKVQPALFKKST